MNRIAISLALVTVCIGIVTANKHLSHHSEDFQDVSYNHHPKYDLSNCEEECTYTCKPRFVYGHGNGHRQRHGKGHGYRQNDGTRGRYDKQVDFYPGQNPPYTHFDEPFYPNQPIHGGDNGFHQGFKQHDFSESPIVGPPRIRKPKGKRGHGRKVCDESGGKVCGRRSEHQPHEAHGASLEAEIDSFRADSAHTNDDLNESIQKENVSAKDITVIQDKSVDSQKLNQNLNRHHDSDVRHASGEHGQVAARFD